MPIPSRTLRNFMGRSEKNIRLALLESGEDSFGRVGESALDIHQGPRVPCSPAEALTGPIRAGSIKAAEIAGTPLSRACCVTLLLVPPGGEFHEMMFPPLGPTAGAVTAVFFAGGNQDVTALRDALDLSLHNAQLRSIQPVLRNSGVTPPGANQCR
jgi:hypothetical protein